MFYNNVQIIGNLTRDPETKALTSGKTVTTFSIAVNESYKNQQGQKVESVEFINCVAWGKTGEIIAQYVKKGNHLMIIGKLKTRSWDKEGVKHYRTEVVIRDFVFGRNKIEQANSPQPVSTPIPPAKAPVASAPPTEAPTQEIPLPTPPPEDGEINVADIPF